MIGRLFRRLFGASLSPVTLVTVHHEGDGDPTDNVARFAAGGYSVGIGTSRYDMFRSPFVSFGTLHYNHVSFDICLSGNRMVHAVTDTEIGLIRAACAQARARGWLVDQPAVRAHHDSPGSNTVCPGTYTYARFGEIIAACSRAVPVPAPLPPPTPVVPTTGGTIVDLAHCHAAFVPLKAYGLGLFCGVYDAGVPIASCHATLHGPAPKVAVANSTDDWWEFSRDGTCRAQQRGHTVVVTAFCPNWIVGEPPPSAHVLAIPA